MGHYGFEIGYQKVHIGKLADIKHRCMDKILDGGHCRKLWAKIKLPMMRTEQTQK